MLVMSPREHSPVSFWQGLIYEQWQDDFLESNCLFLTFLEVTHWSQTVDDKNIQSDNVMCFPSVATSLVLFYTL